MSGSGEARASNVGGDRLYADAGLFEKAREKSAELIGRRPEPGLLLLRDLRELHLLYAEAWIDYVILGQAPKPPATRAARRLSQCHAQTLRGMKWTVTRLKTAAPQVLTSDASWLSSARACGRAIA
jgi:hypothetical protein